MTEAGSSRQTVMVIISLGFVFFLDTTEQLSTHRWVKASEHAFSGQLLCLSACC